MSVATMNRYFREVLAMSPLQYQKRVRLLEAKRLLASRQVDVSGAAYTVGYSSPSQFNREYRQLFGTPPGRDAIRN
jgi:AraC-like DNA-binding protein